MDYFRNVLLVIKNESEIQNYLNAIPNWNYRDDIPTYGGDFAFCLVNRKENIVISFKKICDCAYRSVNVLPFETNEITICEPQEKNIYDDILYKLCVSIKNKFANYEVLCGIIPCENDGN